MIQFETYIPQPFISKIIIENHSDYIPPLPGKPSVDLGEDNAAKFKVKILVELFQKNKCVLDQYLRVGVAKFTNKDIAEPYVNLVEHSDIFLHTFQTPGKIWPNSLKETEVKIVAAGSNNFVIPSEGGYSKTYLGKVGKAEIDFIIDYDDLWKIEYLSFAAACYYDFGSMSTEFLKETSKYFITTTSEIVFEKWSMTEESSIFVWKVHQYDTGLNHSATPNGPYKGWFVEHPGTPFTTGKFYIWPGAVHEMPNDKYMAGTEHGAEGAPYLEKKIVPNTTVVDLRVLGMCEAAVSMNQGGGF